MAEKEYPKSCPLCGSEPKHILEKFCEYACGSRFNYRVVAIVFGSDECLANKLDNPATEYLFTNLDQAKRAFEEQRNHHGPD